MIEISEKITLKWGTLKGWDISPDNQTALALLNRYREIGASASAMAQDDTPEQKQIIIDLISLPGMKVYLDWDGKYVSQQEGVEYITRYKSK